MERALVHGFYPRDMFILLAKNRIIGHNHKNNQSHARKYHSYFWVFEKKACNVPYNIDTILEINRKMQKVKIKSINMIKRHTKPTKENKGGIISKENFIHLSNIKSVDEKKKKESSR